MVASAAGRSACGKPWPRNTGRGWSGAGAARLPGGLSMDPLLLRSVSTPRSPSAGATSKLGSGRRERTLRDGIGAGLGRRGTNASGSPCRWSSAGSDVRSLERAAVPLCNLPLSVAAPSGTEWGSGPASRSTARLDGIVDGPGVDSVCADACGRVLPSSGSGTVCTKDVPAPVGSNRARGRGASDDIPSADCNKPAPRSAKRWSNPLMPPPLPPRAAPDTCGDASSAAPGSRPRPSGRRVPGGGPR